MPDHSTRRRWSYSLRSLFVLVTVFCVCLGHQVTVVRNRHTLLAAMPEVDLFLKQLPDGNEFYYVDAESDWGTWLLHNSQGSSEEKRTRLFASVPWYRRLLGDRPVAIIMAPTRDADALTKAFPEAAVVHEAKPSPLAVCRSGRVMRRLTARVLAARQIG